MLECESLLGGLDSTGLAGRRGGGALPPAEKRPVAGVFLDTSLLDRAICLCVILIAGCFLCRSLLSIGAFLWFELERDVPGPPKMFFKEFIPSKIYVTIFEIKAKVRFQLQISTLKSTEASLIKTLDSPLAVLNE